MLNFLLFEGLSDAQPGCPSVGCPYILHPKECRADAWLMRDGMLCKDCDKCIPQGKCGVETGDSKTLKNMCAVSPEFMDSTGPNIGLILL